MVLRLVNLAFALSALFNGASIFIGANLWQLFEGFLDPAAALDAAPSAAVLLAALAVNFCLPASIVLWGMVAFRWDLRLPEPTGWLVTVGLVLSWLTHLALGAGFTYLADNSSSSDVAAAGATGAVFVLFPAFIAVLVLGVSGVIIEVRAFLRADRDGEPHRTALLAWSTVPFAMLIAPLVMA